MALRNNVQDIKLDLWHEVKPLEYYLIEIIIDKTIKWRTKMAKISIEELMERTRLDHSRIYRALKTLEQKKIITRYKVRHDWFIGLNEEYFGGLLIKRHEEAQLERRKKIRIVVDNSEKHGDNSKNLFKSSTPSVQDLDASGTNFEPDIGKICTGKETQEVETIGEMRSLNTLLKDISLKTSLKESTGVQTGIAESFTLPKKGAGTGDMTAEEAEKRKAILREQRKQLIEQEKMKA